MTSRALWLLLTSILTMPAAEPAKTPAVASARTNVVFILADDLGWMDLGVQGSRFHRTPNIDALAARGMRFANAYAANPYCSPTRASILTGKYPARLGMTMPYGHVGKAVLTGSVRTNAEPYYRATEVTPVNRLVAGERTIADAFRQAGYATAHLGKWHLGDGPHDPLHHGYDIDLPGWPGPGPKGYIAPWRYPAKLNFTGKRGEHIEDRMAREAAQFIAANRDRPFLLSYWAFSVHSPFQAKPDLIADYRRRVDPADPQRNALYAAMVHSLDDAVGTIVAELERQQLLERTLIVFTSDNGGDMYSVVDGLPPTSNAPLRNGKGTPYEGGTRVPCVVAWPGRIDPGVSDALVSSIDWAPTLHELCATPLIDGQRFDGISIVPALHGQPLARDGLFCHMPHNTGTRAIAAVWMRQGDWKLIRFFFDAGGGRHRHELYDLARDPGETDDRSAADAQRVAVMDARIDEHLRATAALVPVANPDFDPTAVAPVRP